MELSMLCRKRAACEEREEQPSVYTKKILLSLRSLLDNRYHAIRLEDDVQEQRVEGACVRTVCRQLCNIPTQAEPNHLGGAKHLRDQVSSWGDAELSVRKVLHHLAFRRSGRDIFLCDSVSGRFLEFHRDITEECGAEDKQHSWAVIEKQEEVVMYGPYYPNYSSGEHSEDVIIKQTQELLESEPAAKGWRVYVFTVNSPCLLRNTDPCMLSLIQKAREWWSVYGVKTYVGFDKCWGFKGTKENLFRGVSFHQLELLERSEEYESYLEAGGRTAEESSFDPLCAETYIVVKRLLRGQASRLMSLASTTPGQDWGSFSKCLRGILEGDAEQGEVLTQEANAMSAAAQELLSERSQNVAEYLGKGKAFASRYTFDPRLPRAVQDRLRRTFEERWAGTIQERYAELVREKLTEDFNRCAVQLFIADVATSSKRFIQIGRVRFTERCVPP